MSKLICMELHGGLFNDCHTLAIGSANCYNAPITEL